MNKIDFETKPIIIGQNIVLRPFESQDIEHMINILNEPELKKLTGSVINDIEASQKMSIDEIETVKEWYRTRNVNLRILISKAYTNKGYGSEALRLFIKYGMEELKFHKISLEVFSFNPRAEKVYINLGFVCEGIKRDDFMYNEEYIDTKILSILESDYNK